MPQNFTRLGSAWPYTLSFLLLPVLLFAAQKGGWFLILPVLFSLAVLSVIDLLVGDNLDNADPQTDEVHLFWHRAVTMVWAPVQILMIFGLIRFAVSAGHLSIFEKFVLFFDVGQVSGVIGIVFAHELMHQKNRRERMLADILMATVLYSHYRSEHLLVHHRYVGTPRDAVTARYNENFHRFFLRILPQALVSAFRAERAKLDRKNLVWWDKTNPFWRYTALQILFILLAILVGGWLGLALFLFQAFVAIWHLEIINYVEHYGLTRKYLGDGKYERVYPRHSWNAAHRVSNWAFINLQRHSDHHIKPDRRYPLLQNYENDEAPNLPFSYPVIFVAALIPPIWLRMMNPKVRHWRAKYYPEITDWSAYKAASNPLPR